jgi:ketosteroid isomerase-like protein
VKRILALAVLVIATSSMTFGQTPSPSPSQTDKPAAQDKATGEKAAAGGAEQEISQLEKGMQDAMLKGETALFEKVATDDYLVINPMGVVGTKAQAVAGASNIKMESFSADDVKVRVYGDAAVVTGRATVKGQLKTAADAAQDISGQYRYTRVYVKQQGQWRLASFQFAPVRQPPAQ